jgi:hypothetical protein
MGGRADWVGKGIQMLGQAGGISKSDEPCISNPKSEIVDWTVQSSTLDFGFAMQDSSNFEIPFQLSSHPAC